MNMSLSLVANSSSRRTSLVKTMTLLTEWAIWRRIEPCYTHHVTVMNVVMKVLLLLPKHPERDDREWICRNDELPIRRAANRPLVRWRLTQQPRDRSCLPVIWSRRMPGMLHTDTNRWIRAEPQFDLQSRPTQCLHPFETNRKSYNGHQQTLKSLTLSPNPTISPATSPPKMNGVLGACSKYPPRVSVSWPDIPLTKTT